MFRPQINAVTDDNRHTVQEMDAIRQKNIAYEYMCHLEEAKKWIEAVLKEELPPVPVLEENLQNGVYLAKLGHFMSPTLVPLEKIYDKEQKRYRIAGLQFRHTDNINYWLKALESAGLPVTFLPETTDVYDRKNMPRVIYCIHALSTHLFKIGRAPLIQDLYGKVEFTAEEIDAVGRELKLRGIQMPAFQKIGGLLSNNVTQDSATLHVAVIAINKALDAAADSLMDELRNPAARLQHLASQLGDKYRLAMMEAKQKKMDAALNKSFNDSYVADVYDELLTQAEIQGHITAVNTTYVWDTALVKDVEALRKAMTLLELNHLNQQNIELYAKEVSRINKKYQGKPLDATMKRRALQDAVTRGNTAGLKANNLIQAVSAVNAALDQDSWHPLFKALCNPILDLGEYTSEFSAPLYYREMKADRQESETDLTLSDLGPSLRVLSAISAVSRAVDCAGPEATWEALSNPGAHFTDLDTALRLRYHQALSAWRRKKLAEAHECPLLTYADVQICVEAVNEGNVNNNKVITWLRRVNNSVRTGDLGLLMGCLADPVGNMADKVDPSRSTCYMKQLQSLRCRKGSDLWLAEVTEAIRAADCTTAAEPSTAWVVGLQAAARGYLVRGRIAKMIQSAVMIQRWWRHACQRRRHHRARADCRAERYRRCLAQIVRIQALWRGHVARRAFQALVNTSQPNFAAVRHFAPQLRQCAGDRATEMRLQDLKGQVVQAIRHNQQLAQQVEAMDLKIGLLIQNRIALLDVANAGKKLAQLARDTPVGGLKSFTKESRDRLDGYQHLLYALQTQPQYLSQLLVLFPQSNTSKMLHSLILPLFSFGASNRDQYLLLRLLHCALREEVRTNLRTPADAITTNPLVLKMAVNFARQQNVLKQIIGPLVEQVMEDSSLCLETNPVDIYKTWRNLQEMESNQVSALPHSVNQDQALGYSEVRTRFDQSLRRLQDIVVTFIAAISEAVDQIPYCLRYMASALRSTLAERFPETPDKDLLKIVGHLVYFSYINSAIVAPDAFDIVTIPRGRILSPVVRRNLASVAKILQFAATKKGFGDESRHLTCLNPFIVSCHDRLKTFFLAVCAVPPPEQHFGVDRYWDAALIERPIVYVTLQELCDTHRLLLTYQDRIAADPMDPLHELLEDLGSEPSVATLLGRPSDDPALSTLAKADVCLALSNKFEVPEDDNTDINKMFIRTKELLVWCLPCLTGQTLRDALLSAETPAQSALYRQSLAHKQNSVSVPSSVSACKTELLQLLGRLELGGCVSSADGYQAVLTAVARDICERGRRRESRRTEMQTLRTARQRLAQKTAFYEEQVAAYNQYIGKCLENLTAGKKNVHTLHTSGKQPGKLKSRMTLRYSAARLHEKGVLAEVQGLPESQLKNVQFEISPTELAGVFTVQGKFMGVVMEKVDLDIQHLLQLQFEGATIMDMFGKAKINVNLLLALLNRKFYGKS